MGSQRPGLADDKHMKWKVVSNTSEARFDHPYQSTIKINKPMP